MNICQNCGSANYQTGVDCLSCGNKLKFTLPGQLTPRYKVHASIEENGKTVFSYNATRGGIEVEATETQIIIKLDRL